MRFTVRVTTGEASPPIEALAKVFPLSIALNGIAIRIEDFKRSIFRTVIISEFVVGH
jgi:hypothetical protein